MLTREQFEERIAVDASGCWRWTGAKRQCGGSLWYGVYHHVYAHRIAYELYREPIPNGFVIDHLCSVGLCVNPDHLQAITQSENVWWTILRGRNRPPPRPTHCPQGHPYAGDNLSLQNGGRHAVCRECARQATRRYRAKQPVQPKKVHYNARKTHCKFGHEFTPENTALLKAGERLCRTCHRERARANRARLGITAGGDYIVKPKVN